MVEETIGQIMLTKPRRMYVTLVRSHAAGLRKVVRAQIGIIVKGMERGVKYERSFEAESK